MKTKTRGIMKKKLILLFLLSAIGLSFAVVTEASAKELDGPECPPGYYFKKGGWSAGGYCRPMGNIGKVR